MKIMSIGDVHARPIWRDIIDKYFDKVDLVIFTGDFADPYEKLSKDEILSEIYGLFSLKDKYPNKVVFLWGNHDLHYLTNGTYKCDRFNAKICEKYNQLLEEYKDKFYYAYQIDNYVWSHAGISLPWFLENIQLLYKNGLKDNLSNIANVLNKIFKTADKNNPLFSVGYYRGGFPEDIGSPIWADAKETIFKFLPGIDQIVGHTQFHKIYKSESNNNSITYIDNLEYGKKPHFLTI